MQMSFIYYAIIVLSSIVIIGGIIYENLWGSYKRTFRSREYCYKDLKIVPISDEEFESYELFRINNIPEDYIIKKRNWLCDEILDYPPDRMHPDMIWDEIPLLSEPCGMGDSDLELDYHIERCGGNPKTFLKRKTFAKVIVDLYKIEMNLPDKHREKCLKEGIILAEKLSKNASDNG